jgi:hypothetical protein
MLLKNIEENIINIFVNACILGYRAGFGVSIYHTSIWFFFHFKAVFSYGN